MGETVIAMTFMNENSFPSNKRQTRLFHGKIQHI